MGEYPDNITILNHPPLAFLTFLKSLGQENFMGFMFTQRNAYDVCLYIFKPFDCAFPRNNKCIEVIPRKRNILVESENKYGSFSYISLYTLFVKNSRHTKAKNITHNQRISKYKKTPLVGLN